MRKVHKYADGGKVVKNHSVQADKALVRVRQATRPNKTMPPPKKGGKPKRIVSKKGYSSTA